MATIFKSISTSMDNIIDKVSPDLITSFMTDLQPLASSGLALYISFGYLSHSYQEMETPPRVKL